MAEESVRCRTPFSQVIQSEMFLRTDPDSSSPMPKTVPTKPYDWTYTSAYAGHCSSNPDIASSASADPTNPSHTIPLAELTRPDPILFYAEIPLYEDELHDNGSSHFVVRIVCAHILIISLLQTYEIDLSSHSASCRNVSSSCLDSS